MSEPSRFLKRSVFLLAFAILSLSLVSPLDTSSSNPLGYYNPNLPNINQKDISVGSVNNSYYNNTYINQTANLTGYWTSNGSSTATGNWDLGSYSLTANEIIFDNGKKLVGPTGYSYVGLDGAFIATRVSAGNLTNNNYIDLSLTSSGPLSNSSNVLFWRDGILRTAIRSRKPYSSLGVNYSAQTLIEGSVIADYGGHKFIVKTFAGGIELQNAVKLTTLTSNGFLKTSSSDGTLSVDTATYHNKTSNINATGYNVTANYFIGDGSLLTNLPIPEINLTPYWLSNGSSTATGNWDLGSYNFTTTGKASFNEADWTGGNIIYVPVGASIQTYINAATAGDTLILGSGEYTTSAAITVNKTLAIIGQGEETVITTSHLNGIYVTVSDVLLENFILNTSATGTIFGVQVNTPTSGVISNVHTKDVQINIIGNPTNSYGLRYANTKGTIKNVKIRTTATTSSQYGMVLANYAAAATPTTIIVENADIEVTSPDATTSVGIYVLDSSATEDVTAYIYNSRIKSAGATTGNALWAGSDDAYAYAYNSILNGLSFDARQAASATLQITNCVLVNNLKKGTITYGGVINNGKAFFADDVSIGLDSKKLFFGTANDASITYDGTNLLINPRDVGTGNVIIGSTSTGVKASQNGLDISSGGNALILGADNNAATRTNATAKASRIGGYHYTNAEEPYAFFLGLSTSTNNQLDIGGGSAAFNTATLLRFFTAADTTTVTGTERMRIASDGKVGIGTTAPGALLDVSSTVTSDGLSPTTLRISGLFSGDWTVGGEMGKLEFYNNDGSTGGANVRGKISSIVEHINGLHWGLGFYTATNNAAPTEKVRITNAGNVGIGTTAPTEKLDVLGNVKINGTLITDSIESLTGENITFFNSTLTGYANLNAKSFNVFSPEDKAYVQDYLTKVPEPSKILGLDGKLARVSMFANERKDNTPIDDLTKPIYQNVTTQECNEVEDKPAIYEEVCENIPNENLEEPKEIEKICRQELVNPATTRTECKDVVNQIKIGYETKFENATDIGAMAFNNRLLITEVKEFITGILNRLTGAEAEIQKLNNANALIKQCITNSKTFEEFKICNK